MPERIQRKRAKGWRMPVGAVYVGRGSKWGNPYKEIPTTYEYGLLCRIEHRGRTSEDILSDYRRYTLPRLPVVELRGKNLACWCPLTQPCHADILLEIANATD
ncbi:MAG TPA: DUF4326 domain-containing protein [Dehalococcoidia bacterium]|nr:DUF4326 domain-containing protein [Dehalococcoidia bacterium]